MLTLLYVFYGGLGRYYIAVAAESEKEAREAARAFLLRPIREDGAGCGVEDWDRGKYEMTVHPVGVANGVSID